MSKQVSFSIPHELGEEEAKRRVANAVAQMTQKYSHLVGNLDASWKGNLLVGRIGALGQVVHGQVTVEPELVKVDLTLPVLLSAISGKIEKFGIGAGHKVLNNSA